MKPIIFKVAIALIFTALLALLAWKFYAPYVFLSLLFGAFWAVIMAREVVDYFYYTKRKKKKIIYLQQHETDALKWAAATFSSNPAEPLMYIWKLLEDKYDITLAEVDDPPACKRIKGYPVKPF